MKLNHQTIKTTRPIPLLDDTSSKTTVYLRRYMGEEKGLSRRASYEDEPTEVTVYKYDELRLPRKTYEAFQMNGANLLDSMFKDSEQMRADLDYIALMSGIDLEEGAV